MSTTEDPGRSSSLSRQPRAGKQLTRKQRLVLTAIQRFSTLQGYMPSVRELGRELGGLAPATVQHHLGMLRKKNYLEHDGGAHGLRLAPAAWQVNREGATPTNTQAGSTPAPFSGIAAELADLAEGGPGDRDGGSGGGFGGDKGWGLELSGMQVVVPLLGTIAAGRPLEAIEEADEYIPIPASLARGSAFVLRVAGSSMIEDAILDGDMVVVQNCETVENGEVAVVLLPDGTATLKRFYLEENRVRLQPANSEMEPMYFEDVHIRGKVVGLIRQFGGKLSH